jgi:iron-sulfur cluster assembly accessory protein
MSITVTDAARSHISGLCQKHGKMVRLSIVAGGCQGFNKVWDMCDSPSDEDEVMEFGPGQLLIDGMSLELIDGATIDYRVDLSGSYFSVEIPSAVSQCGCGTSFSI